MSWQYSSYLQKLNATSNTRANGKIVLSIINSTKNTWMNLSGCVHVLTISSAQHAIVDASTNTPVSCSFSLKILLRFQVVLREPIQDVPLLFQHSCQSNEEKKDHNLFLSTRNVQNISKCIECIDATKIILPGMLYVLVLTSIYTQRFSFPAHGVPTSIP